MIRFSLFAFGISLTLLLGSASSRGSDDKVADDLEKAKSKFEADSKKLRADILDDFDKRETKARDKGDKKLVEKIKDEKRVFELHGILTVSADKGLKKRVADQVKMIEKAYTDATKAYFKAKKNDLSAGVEKEWKQLQAEGIITNASIERTELWIPLFNGKDLTGWEKPAKGGWSVDQDGVLQGMNDKDGDSRSLASLRSDFENFHLRMELMYSSGCEATLGFRHAWPVYRYWTTLTGEKAENWRDIGFNAGQLKNVLKMPQGECPPTKQWFTFELIARGDSITTMVNGEKMAQVINENEKKVANEKGKFVLVVNPGGKDVRIRKIEVLLLPSFAAEKK